MTEFKLAQKTFKPGTLVEIKPDVLDMVIEKQELWKFCAVGVGGERLPGLEFRSARIIRLRDSDDDPLVCVCATSDAGQSACGWFHPHELVVA